MIFALMSPDPAWSMKTDVFWNGEKETLEKTRDHSTGKMDCLFGLESSLKPRKKRIYNKQILNLIN